MLRRLLPLLCLFLVACDPPPAVLIEDLDSGELASEAATEVAPAAEGTLEIAVVQAFSGKFKRTADNTLDGARLAVEQLNARGGVAGHRLALRELDTRGTRPGADLAATWAVEAGPIAAIGPARSVEAQVVVPHFDGAAVPLVLHLATNPELTSSSPYAFRVCYNDALQGKVLARFARENLGAARAVLVTDENSTSNIRLTDSFNRSFRFLGGVVAAELALDDAADPAALIAEIARHQPDVVLASMYVFDAGELVRLGAESGLEARFLGGDGWGNSNLFITAGETARGNFFSTHWSEELETAPSIAFCEAFFQRYERVPTIASALAYDAVQVIAAALETLPDTPTPEALRAALAGLSGFTGVTGAIGFDEQGDAVKPVCIQRIGMFRFEHEIELAGGEQ